MIEIKFSHHYDKMPRDYESSKLLDVLPVKLEDLSASFLKYDTAFEENGTRSYYPLPKKGDFMILLLQAGEGHGRLWTTIRRQTPQKEAYYRSNIGEMVRCIVTEAA